MDSATEARGMENFNVLRFKNKAKPRLHPYQDSYQIEPIKALDPLDESVRLNLTASESS